MRIMILLATSALSLAGCTAHPTNSEHQHGAEPVKPAPLAAATATPQEGHAGHEQAPRGSTGAAPSGYAPVPLDPARAGGLKLATVKVEEHDFRKALRGGGVVAVDETRTADVHPKVRGVISGLRADFVGQKIKAGETLCSIYSQEVFAAELEFLALLDRAKGPSAPQSEFAQAEARAQQQLLDAARRRLSLWDVPRAEIARLEATREPRRTFALAAPRSGVIVIKQAIDGMYVEPSMALYTLSDLSKVWILVDVYEADVPYLHIGDPAHLTVEGVPEPIHAKVAFLPPSIDEATRTLKARFELANDDGRLRPGAFVSAVMDLPLGKGLGVPENAVIRTGTRAIVFVVRNGQAEPRDVRLGPLVGDQYRIEAGLNLGDEVATGAQFLLDSESRLRASSAPQGGHGH
jgi:membrane fusion protein, copper/silver efflux system